MSFKFTIFLFLLSLLFCPPLFADDSLQETVHEAIEDLVESNQNFVASKKDTHFDNFADGQDPRVTMVLCSDSRVQGHHFSEDGENDVFMARNIGNQFATTRGSVTYGVNVLKTPVLIFIGHSHCGAVKAAMGDFSGLEAPIRKELDTLKLHGMTDEKKAVIENIHHQVSAALKAFKGKVTAEELAILGAVYDFRDDYGHGKGQLIIVNLNGSRDPATIRASHYLDGLRGVSVGVSD